MANPMNVLTVFGERDRSCRYLRCKACVDLKMCPKISPLFSIAPDNGLHLGGILD